MSKKTIGEQVSEWAAGLRFDDLKPEQVHIAKRFILDNVGCILGGKTEESSKSFIRVIKQYGGAPQSTVLGHGFKTSAANAAMANGTVGHALELDDDHRIGCQHPAVIVVPTALAVGEMVGASGRDIIAAVVAGCETTIRAGEAFLGEAYYQGFHPTGTCGVFGSAVAAGKLLGLSVSQMVNALGIAGSQSSGLREWKSTGAWSKRYQAGHANFAGTMAAMMAKENFTGPWTIFEGTYGFLRAYSYQLKYDENLLVKDLGIKYEMEDTSIKPHACCRFCQPLVDCTLALVKQYDLYPKDIKKVRAGTGKNTLIALTEPRERKYRPQTSVDAQFSLPFSVAIAIHRRVALAEEFNPKYFEDPNVHATMDKIEGYLDADVEACWPESYPAVVTIETVDGRTFTQKIDFPKGDPENPVTDEELEEKFKYLTHSQYSGAEIKTMIDALKNLDQIVDIKDLTAVLIGSEKECMS